MQGISLTLVSLSLTASSRRTLIAGSVPYAPFPQHLGSFKGQPKVIGPASTLKLVAKNSITSPLPESSPNAIPKGQHWVDLTNEGTVMVIEQPEGQSCAAIGGIMALRMKTRGATGCVVGGRVRDLEELNNCGLPVSAPGTITECGNRKHLHQYWLVMRPACLAGSACAVPLPCLFLSV